jgi:hypothetical protein
MRQCVNLPINKLICYCQKVIVTVSKLTTNEQLSEL